MSVLQQHVRNSFWWYMTCSSKGNAPAAGVERNSKHFDLFKARSGGKRLVFQKEESPQTLATEGRMKFTRILWYS
jgi:hypothetical protein